MFRPLKNILRWARPRRIQTRGSILPSREPTQYFHPSHQLPNEQRRPHLIQHSVAYSSRSKPDKRRPRGAIQATLSRQCEKRIEATIERTVHNGMTKAAETFGAKIVDLDISKT
ncbi:hypothetical protein ACJZ2D_010834 [Fusarium nematophilum]